MPKAIGTDDSKSLYKIIIPSYVGNNAINVRVWEKHSINSTSFPMSVWNKIRNMHDKNITFMTRKWANTRMYLESDGNCYQIIQRIMQIYSSGYWPRRTRTRSPTQEQSSSLQNCGRAEEKFIPGGAPKRKGKEREGLCLPCFSFQAHKLHQSSCPSLWEVKEKLERWKVLILRLFLPYERNHQSWEVTFYSTPTFSVF